MVQDGHLDYPAGMLYGSCACGRVRYEIRGELLGPITYCHCWRYRKHSHFMVGSKAPWVEINDGLPQETGVSHSACATSESRRYR
jgi:hypothetical protein